MTIGSIIDDILSITLGELIIAFVVSILVFKLLDVIGVV